MCFSDLHKGFQGVYPPQAQLLWSFLPSAIGILLSQGAKPWKLGKMGGDRWFVHTWPWWWRSCWILMDSASVCPHPLRRFQIQLPHDHQQLHLFKQWETAYFWGYHRTPSLRAYIVHKSVLEKSMTRLPNSLSVKAHVPPPGKIAQTVQSNFTTCFFMFTLFHQEMIRRKWTYVSSKLKPLWVENTVVTPSELTTCYFWIWCLEHQSV